jgi:hypothetical protein
MALKQMHFQLDNDYLITSYSQPPDAQAEEIDYLKARMGLLGSNSGMYRYMFCKDTCQLFFIIIFFVAFLLIMPIYIEYGKAEALFTMSVMFFVITIPFCWQSLSQCSRLTTRHKMIKICQEYIWNKGSKMQEDFMRIGWELQVDSNLTSFTINKLKDTDIDPENTTVGLMNVEASEFIFENQAGLGSLVIGPNQKLAGNALTDDSDTSTYESVMTSGSYEEYV